MSEATPSTALAAVNPQVAQPSAQTISLILNESHMAQMFKFAEMMACGIATVPKHLQKNPADCLAVVMQATQWGMNPFAVAQKTHIVNGALGYEAQLVNAVLQSTGAIKGAFAYEYTGTEVPVCRVGAVITGHEAITWGEWLSAATVTTKNSPLWKTNPKQQLGYLQVKNWARSYCPGAILGVYTPDELETPSVTHMGAAEVVMPATPTTYPADQFEKNLPAWQKVITTGRKNAEQIIAMAESKFPLSDAQKETIRATKTVEDAKTSAPVVTYAAVADKLRKAEDVDLLDAAADLIGEVADAEQRAELAAIYEDRKTTFTA